MSFLLVTTRYTTDFYIIINIIIWQGCLELNSSKFSLGRVFAIQIVSICFHGNVLKLHIFCFRKLANSNQAWPECYIIIKLLTNLPSLSCNGEYFYLVHYCLCTDLAVLGLYCHDLGPRDKRQR